MSVNVWTKCSASDRRSVLTPVDVREMTCVKLFSFSIQLYSMETSPTSAMQMSPRFSAMAFMASRTRHAPVPLSRRIFPTRPTRADFSSRRASFTGTLPSTARSYQGMVLCITTRLLFIWKTFFLSLGTVPVYKSS